MNRIFRFPIVLILLFVIAGCGGSDLVVRHGQASHVLIVINKDESGGIENAQLGFSGFLDTGGKVGLSFFMPPAVLAEGYENNGDWLNEHFVSLLVVHKGEAKEVYKAFDNIRFKIVNRTPGRLVFSVAGRYFDAGNNQYASVEPMTLTWYGDLLQDISK